MRIEITADAARFRSPSETFRLRDPLRHTVIANHLTGTHVDIEHSRFLSVHDDGTLIGAAMRAAGVYLGELPAGSVVPLADAIAEFAMGPRSCEGRAP